MDYVVYWNELPPLCGVPLCSCTQNFDSIDPLAKRPLTFNFANGLPAGINLASAALTVECIGTDPSPASRFSSPVVTSPTVTVVANGCQNGNTYHLRMAAPTTDSNTILVLAADLVCAEE